MTIRRADLSVAQMVTCRSTSELRTSSPKTSQWHRCRRVSLGGAAVVLTALSNYTERLSGGRGHPPPMAERSLQTDDVPRRLLMCHKGCFTVHLWQQVWPSRSELVKRPHLYHSKARYTKICRSNVKVGDGGGQQVQPTITESSDWSIYNLSIIKNLSKKYQSKNLHSD